MNAAGAVLSATAEAAYVAESDLRGPGRAREYSYPRHVAIVLLRDHCGYSFYRIAALMGGRHIQTVIEAYWRTKARLRTPGEHSRLYHAAVSRMAERR